MQRDFGTISVPLVAFAPGAVAAKNGTSAMDHFGGSPLVRCERPLCPARARIVGAGPRALPAPDDALLPGDPSPLFQEGHQRLRSLLRDAHRRSPDELREGLRLQPGAAGSGRGNPPALSAR